MAGRVQSSFAIIPPLHFHYAPPPHLYPIHTLHSTPGYEHKNGSMLHLMRNDYVLRSTRHTDYAPHGLKQSWEMCRYSCIYFCPWPSLAGIQHAPNRSQFIGAPAIPDISAGEDCAERHSKPKPKRKPKPTPTPMPTPTLQPCPRIHLQLRLCRSPSLKVKSTIQLCMALLSVRSRTTVAVPTTASIITCLSNST